MENVNFCLVIVCGILLVCGLSGLVMGLVRKASGIIALILSGILVSILLPVVTETLRHETAVESVIMEKCREVGEGLIVSFLSQKGEEEGQSGVLSQSLPETDIASLMKISKADQVRLIDSLPIPEGMRTQITELNNDQGYEKFSAGNFADFLTGYFAALIFNALCFLLTLLLVYLVIRVLFLMADLFTSLPMIGTLNRLGGLLAGLLQGLLIIWALFLILSLFAGSETGMMLLEQIYGEPFLKELYTHNLYLAVANHTLEGFTSTVSQAFLP